MSGETQPVAWRVKDYADGWVRYGTEAEAKREAKRTGALIEPLYSAAALAPAVPEGWEREARQHIVELEQCSLFVDSAPLAKAMTNAADFLRKLATSDARPLPTEGDAGRAALEAEKTGGEP